MNRLRIIFKRAIITTIIILCYGLVVQKKEVIIGMFSGALISVVSLYMLSIDVKNIVMSGEGTYRRGVIGYFKRYLLYFLYLMVMGFLGGKNKDTALSMLICSGLGLLNVKINILFMALSDKFIKYVKKSKK